MFTTLVRWHAGTVSFSLSDVILAQLACPLSDVVFYLHSGITYQSLYKHWYEDSKAWLGWLSIVLGTAWLSFALLGTAQVSSA